MRLAWSAYPPRPASTASSTALEVAIAADAYLAQQEGFDQHVLVRRVVAVLDHYEKNCFTLKSYASADQTGVGAQQSLDTMNRGVFAMKEGKMFDDNLTVLTLTSIFAAVNWPPRRRRRATTTTGASSTNSFRNVCATPRCRGLAQRRALRFTLQAWLLIFLLLSCASSRTRRAASAARPFSARLPCSQTAMFCLPCY